MKIRILKQVMAIALSLGVATPGWAANPMKLKAPVDEGPALTQETAIPIAMTDVATNEYQTEIYGKLSICKGDKVVTTNLCEAAFDGVVKRAETVAALSKANEKKNELMSALRANHIDAGKLQSDILQARVSCVTKVNACIVKCSGEIRVPTLVGTDQVTYEADKAAYAKVITGLKETQASCPLSADNTNTYAGKFDVSLVQVQAGKNGILSAMMSIKGLAITGAVVGGAYLLTHKDKDKKDEASDTDKTNGVITNTDGTKTTCFTADSYAKAECKSTLISLCQSTKADTSGCRAFESAYCANEGNGSNYCLYAEAKVYCSQAGSMISSSPACTWKSARASACLSDPEAVSCLATGTVEALTLSCANYPNDPLCKANAAGRVVVQGGSSLSTTSVATAAATSTNSVSMSSVIGNSSSTSSAPNLQVIAGDNLWSASSSAVQKACATGQLLNCL